MRCREKHWKIKERYVLSDKEKEVDLAKNVEIIFDIFSLEINEKRILNKLYSEMNELAKSEEFFVKTQEVILGIQKYLLDLEYATDYILTFEQALFENDVKMYGIQTKNTEKLSKS